MYDGALLPPFVDTASPVLPQLVVLSATRATLFIFIAHAHVLAASRLRRIPRGEELRDIRNKVSLSPFVPAATNIEDRGH